MENEFRTVGALIGVAIVVVSFILVVLLGKILLKERQEREKEKLAKIKLDKQYRERILELKEDIDLEKERTKSLESILRHNLAAAAVFKDKTVKKEESSDIEKKELNSIIESIIEELRLKLDKYETRRKPAKKKSI